MSTDPSPADAARTTRGRFIAFRPDRLGARLVSLMNAMRLAETLGADFACAWTESAGVGQTFNDPAELFDADFVRRHFLSPAEWRAARPEALTLSGSVRDPHELSAVLARDGDVIVGSAFGIMRLEGEPEDETVARFRQQFTRIPFAGPVRAAMGRLDTALAGHTAYHIRRGDLTDDLKAKNKAWPHKVVPDEFYERHMAAELERGQRGVVLFSDQPDTITHFRAAFPALKTVADLLDPGSLTEAQRDLVELYAMSRCGRIIAPERSAFSSTAAELTGAERRDVTEDIAPVQADEAAEALVRRLHDRPESFGGDGRIGQALLHAGAHLEREGRIGDAAALFARRVDAGLNISFIYPQTMRYQHRAGDTEGVLRTARRMAAGEVMHVKDYAAAEMLHGYAHLRRGDRGAALTHIVNGFWHQPGAPTARVLVPVLVESGVLTEANFLPISAVQTGLQRRRGLLKLLNTDFPGLDTLSGITVPHALGTVETALWDWAPLLPALSMTAAVRKGLVERAAEQLSRAKVGPGDEPELASLAAILHAHGGDPERAVHELTELAGRNETHPMTWQRLSHAHWQARKFGKAAETAAHAATLADWPALRAWAGMTLLRVREHDQAVGQLAAADAALPGWPWVAGLLSQALQRAGREDEALAAVVRALELAPMQVEFAMQRAKLLDGAGRTAEAVAVLERMVEVQRAPGKLFLALIDMLQRQGDAERVRATIETAHARIPRHPRIAQLAGAA